MRQLGDILAPVRGRLAIACALYAIGAAASVATFVAIAEVGLALLREPLDADGAWTAALAGTAALVLRLACLLAASGLNHLADSDLQLSVQRRLVDHLGRVPLGWFSARNGGAVKKAMADDVAALHHLVAHAFTDLTAAVVAPLLTIAYLGWINWRFTLVACVPLVAGLALYALQMRGYATKVAAYDAALTRINAASVEFVQGIGVVKAFGQTGRAHRRFAEAADDFTQTFWQWVRGLLGLAAAAEIVSSPPACLTVILAAGTLFVAEGWLQPAELVVFAVLGVGLPGPIVALGYAASQLQLGRQAAGRLQALLRTPTLATPSAPRRPQGHEVRFEGVGFSYDGVHRALASVDLVLAPGTVTALVGASGAGKTTLAQLLARFHDPSEGRILLGSVELAAIDRAELRRHVGFVFQDALLLRASVADNLRLGRPAATDAVLERAARAAHIHDRIVALPRGYETLLGIEARLSGGEQQRLSIARALVADAPILVLDEATAYADPDAEAAIQRALSRLAAGRTLLVVAHRLAIVKDADQIVLLDGGRIAERGHHDELVERGGAYAALWAAHERAAARSRVGVA